MSAAQPEVGWDRVPRQAGGGRAHPAPAHGRQAYEVPAYEVAAYEVTAVVPVKRLARAKSRLALPPDQREALALAFALDTISALSESPLVSGVLVVTADPVVRRCAQQSALQVVPDVGTGLLPAVRAGCRAAATSWPGVGVVVVPADLPCLRAEDVTHVLQSARTADGAFVPDREGTGTTLLVTAPGRAAVAQYGPASAARHRVLGLRSLDDASVRARHDVDTLEDLVLAETLGLGPETAAQLARLELPSVPQPAR